MQHVFRKRSFPGCLLQVAAMAMLAACGGGGGGSNAPLIVPTAGEYVAEFGSNGIATLQGGYFEGARATARFAAAGSASSVIRAAGSVGGSSVRARSCPTGLRIPRLPDPAACCFPPNLPPTPSASRAKASPSSRGRTETSCWSRRSGWDAVSVGECIVIKEGNVYKMWSTGHPNSTRTPSYIGYATSTDGGLTWEPYAGNPVLSPGTRWESARVEFPSVIKVTGGYWVFYTGELAHSIARTGRAFSTDELIGRKIQ